MASPHPLNQAVIAQALHDLRNGQLRRCLSMGFSAHALEALKQPTLVSVLVNSKVAWCSVKVNSDIVARLLEQVCEVQKEIEKIDRMLRLSASTEMVSEFFALTHQEVALRRQMLGLPNRKGRWPVLSEAQDASLWERWRAELESRRIAIVDDNAMLELSMDLAEEHSLPLSVVWGSIRTWIEQKML
jgi:ribosomal protein S10